jgi:hypothetical protein
MAVHANLARAANISVVDNGSTIAVSAGYFDDGGFYVNGVEINFGGSTVTDYYSPSTSLTLSGGWNDDGDQTTTTSTSYYWVSGSTVVAELTMGFSPQGSDAVLTGTYNDFAAEKVAAPTLPVAGPSVDILALGSTATIPAPFLTANAEVTQPIAEPTSLALLGAGLVGLTVIRRRRTGAVAG